MAAPVGPVRDRPGRRPAVPTGAQSACVPPSVDLVVRAFAGLQTEANALTFDPRLPNHLGRIGFQVQYRGYRIEVSLSAQCLQIRLQPGTALPIHIGVEGNYAVLAGGQGKEFPLVPPGRQDRPA